MKRKLMVTVVLTAAMIGGGSGAVLAGHGPGGCGGPYQGMELGRGGFEWRMAKILKLSEAQQSQIKTLLDAEREQARPLFDKLHESRKLLRQAAEAPVFDEAAVRAIAVDQAKIETELTVSRTRVHSRINALLTPEQRELAKDLRPDMERQSPPSP